MALPVLVVNSGSSSIKFSFYEAEDATRRKLLEGEAEGIGSSSSEHEGKFWIKSWLDGNDGRKIVDAKPALPDLSAAFKLISEAISRPTFPRPGAIGHRMVCGGPTVIENQCITPSLIEEMERYTEFAPLHAPSEIFLMRRMMEIFPDVPNFVCLDSWFHRDLPQVTRQLPIPEEYTLMGLRRFGAHGLSYESIVAHLGPHVPKRLIVAHLGNGVSICAIRDGRSIDTSMGLTPAGGLISGTRTGDIDPGVLLFLLRRLGETSARSEDAAGELEALVNKKSGLRGLSELSNDMRSLREAIDAGNAKARLAVDAFVYTLQKFIGAYFAVLGGADMLVFTGGIGENDAATRAEVCKGLEVLHIEIDKTCNQDLKGEGTISPEGSPVVVKVIPAAEDLTIVNHVCRLLKA